MSENLVKPETNLSSSDLIRSAPKVELPKGGGAIRGIGEKFAANPVTGTGSMTVPIATSPGRSGFGPQLSLSYDSGSGNGPFGFGWSFSLPSITRKTDKGLPRYLDDQESDEFILSGAEDLVPMLKKTGDNEWQEEAVDPRPVAGNTYDIKRYRPRIEGLFARIERWTNQTDTADSFWRSISKDNITTWYGRTDKSRIADPEDRSKIYSWLICESYDDKGNTIVYGYEEENSDKLKDLDTSQAHERNRTKDSRSANRYLKRIRYGNHASYFPELKDDQAWPSPPGLTDADASQNWYFEVVLDYGEHNEEVPFPDTQNKIPCRFDPFSSYRPGFEVRTYRLCQRILMFHHFLDEHDVGKDCLVRSTDFKYRYEDVPDHKKNPIYSLLTEIVQCGYKRNTNVGYTRRSLPPLQFEYTEAEIQHELKKIDSKSLENLPQGLDGSLYQWADLDGEGAGGILTEQGGSWFYKRNLSPLPVEDEHGKQKHSVRFAPTESINPLPSFSSLANGEQQIMDLAGDGQVDVVTYEQPIPGFFERTKEGGWKPHKPFKSLPNISWKDPNLKFVDLTGDGHADVLITEDQAYIWFASLAEQGFSPAQQVQKVLDEELGPRLVFADGTQSIYLSDMSGDGLTDLVRIRNGEVCYWPNLGYCRFGAKVSMDNPPWFEAPDLFDQKRIRLADIDGSGVTDILYLKHNCVDIHLNQSGNSWADAIELKHLPAIDNITNIMVTDLMGNGTACLVWSSPLPGNARSPMSYVDLMGGQKPHLLTQTINNLGAETHVHYAPSTKFYLKDQQDGKEWITRLHFPVHVVEQVETYDRISNNRFATRYAYHHGYFDGHEREFRGFGMVEQWDTETYAVLSSTENLPIGNNIDKASHIPPAHTKTWYHTGVYLGHERISNFFAGLGATNKGEYFSGDAEAHLLDDTVLPDEGLTIDEEREACRALKGQMLRQEVYADDGTDKEKLPYTVTEQNFTIKRLQPKGDNQHAVFFTHAREVLNYHYERNPNDPRIQHAITLEVNDYGNVLKSIAIGYDRRTGMSSLQGDDLKKQRQMLVTYTESRMTNSINKNKGDQVFEADIHQDNYRAPLPCEVRTYELTGVTPDDSASYFSFNDLTNNDLHKINSLSEVPYEHPKEFDKKEKRLIEHLRTLYRKNNLEGLLPLGRLQSMALPGESYKLAFTPGLVDSIYRRNGHPLIQNYDNVLGGQGDDQGGYLSSQSLRNKALFPADHLDANWTLSDNDNHWWIPSGRSFFSESPIAAAQEEAEARKHFYLPKRYQDPFGQESTVTYDDGPADINKPRYDLLVSKTTDALGNHVTAKNNYRVLQPEQLIDPNENHTIVAFDALGLVVGTAVQGNVAAESGDDLKEFVADLNHTDRTGFYHADAPHLLAEELLKNATTRIIYDLDCYHTEGRPPFAATLARETHVKNTPPSQLKIQISFSYSDGFGREIQKKIQAEPEKYNGPLRWVGSGWTIFNNKGKPIRQYEPFFSQLSIKSHQYEFDKKAGVSPILFYDPVGRVVATIHPNHSWEKVVFDPWRQERWDVNDTVKLDPRDDDDIGGFVEGYFKEIAPNRQDWQTWLQKRNVDPDNPPDDTNGQNPQRDAAVRTLKHAGTSTVAHFDALGRAFLSIADNGKDQNGDDLLYETRTSLDIEGNQREVKDAKGRIVMRYNYYMAGPEENEDGSTPNRIHQASMEAGERWILNDVTGNPVRSWDSRGHEFHTVYDPLRRPIEQYVTGEDSNLPDSRLRNRKVLFEKIEYGEDQTDDIKLNLRTRVFKQFDGAGVITNEEYDFKGNLNRSKRQLCSDHATIPDWSLNPQPLLDGAIYASFTRYDALNRPTQQIAPHDTTAAVVKRDITQITYNDANLLEAVHAWLAQANEPPGLLATNTADHAVVRNIDYNAKGQRELIEYGNGAITHYHYEDTTFRLIHLYTRRDARYDQDCGGKPPPPRFVAPIPEQLIPNIPCGIQNLRYTYDPVGNITHIHDLAQPRVFFDNQCIEASNDYLYDPIYRLIAASGREHKGNDRPPGPSNRTREHNVPYPAPCSNNELQRYTEHYRYDEVGNIMEMAHRVGGTLDNLGQVQWRRRYQYTTFNNQLRSTSRPGEDPKPEYSDNPADYYKDTYSHDRHGNMITMPHLSGMMWDFKDQLLNTTKQVVNDEPPPDVKVPETTHYVYDSNGQRIRKVTFRQNGSKKDERIYLGGVEIYRQFNGNGIDIKLQRESVHVMDDTQRVALIETKTIDDTGVMDARNNDVVDEAVIRYQINNHLGSACVELNGEASVISYEEYHPYGTTAYHAKNRSVRAAAKRYRYSGKERDEENGFYYFGMRYCAAWLGRWMSADSIFLIGNPNLYSFSNLNPLRFRDSEGQQPEPVVSPPSTSGRRIGNRSDLENIVKQLATQRLGPGPDPDFNVKELNEGEFPSIRQNQEIKSCLVNSVRYVVQRKFGVMIGGEAHGDRVMWSIIKNEYVDEKKFEGEYGYNDMPTSRRLENAKEWFHSIGIESQVVQTSNLKKFIDFDKNRKWEGAILVEGVYRSGEIASDVSPGEVGAGHTYVINEAVKLKKGKVNIKVYDPFHGYNLQINKGKGKTEWIDMSEFLRDFSYHFDKKGNEVSIEDPNIRSKADIRALIIQTGNEGGIHKRKK